MILHYVLCFLCSISKIPVTPLTNYSVGVWPVLIPLLWCCQLGLFSLGLGLLWRLWHLVGRVARTCCGCRLGQSRRSVARVALCWGAKTGDLMHLSSVIIQLKLGWKTHETYIARMWAMYLMHVVGQFLQSGVGCVTQGALPLYLHGVIGVPLVDMFL